MSTQWKPGDVVTATVNGRENVRLVAGLSRFDPQLRWCEMSPRWGDGDDDECWFFPSSVTDHRPLVAIDPEDREAVERLLARFCDAVDRSDVPAHPQGWSVNAMQAALREFANPKPPRPEEPTGLGAVVEDEEGERWVRSHPGVNAWTRPHLSGTYAYEQIAAAQVLSDGVPND